MSTLTDFVQNNDQWGERDLFVVIPANGYILRACSGQQDLVLGGNTYYHCKHGHWTRDSIATDATQRGQVNELQVTVTADSAVLFPNSTKPLLQATKLFSRASIEVSTAYVSIDAPTTIVGSQVVFFGHMTVPSVTSTQAVWKCSEITYLLQKPWPVRVFQRGCPFALFDANCRLNKADFALARTVSGINGNIITLNTAVTAAPYYDKGFLTFTSGEYSGFTMTIVKQVDTTHVEINNPAVLTIHVGDAFTIYPGCDGKKGTCTSKFNNADNYGGVDFIPPPPAAFTGSGS